MTDATPVAIADEEGRRTPLWVWFVIGFFIIGAAVVMVIIAANEDDDDDVAGGSVATITTSLGDIVIELDTENAPVASGQFIQLANDGFYDGLTFHRVVPNFVIQGGDPNGDGSGGSGTSVVGETPADGYPIGSLAAAKAGNEPAGTFDSQFFIVTGEDGTTLPPDYARFGMVVEGLDVAQQIEALAPEGDGPPTETVTIEKIVIS